MKILDRRYRITSRSTPIERERLPVVVMDAVAVIFPIVAVVAFDASWLDATVTWGFCSTVAQLMRINVTLKAQGVRSFRWRQEGGTWRREQSKSN